MLIRLLIVILLLVGSLSAARGQQQLDPFELGFRVGFNSSLLYNYDTNAAYQGKLGLSIGGLAKFRFFRWLAVQPELLYSQQGTTYESDFGSFSPALRKVKNDYFIVPVLLKLYPTRRFNIQVGPQLGVLVSSTTDGVDSRNEFTPADLSLALGVGYEFNAGLLLSIRLSSSFTNVDNPDTDSSLPDNPQQLGNGLLLFSAGWRF